MAIIKGLGLCLLCGSQIEEGEPINTVVLPGGPVIGHSRCVTGFHMRKREEDMVKIARQQGPGGPVDMTQAEDAVMGSIPLEKPEKPEETVEPEPVGTSGTGDLGASVAPVGGIKVEGNLAWNTIELAELESAHEAKRQELLDRRREQEQKPITPDRWTHTIDLDLSSLPPGADFLQIRLDLTKLRRS